MTIAMKRFVLFLVVAVYVSTAVTEAAEPTRPNIIFLLTDD